MAALKKWERGDGRLPVATTDLEQVKRDFDEFGYGLIKDCLSPSQTAAIHQRILGQAAGERKLLGLDNPIAQGVRVLPNKGAIFRDLILQPQVTEVMRHGFGGQDFIMSTMTGIITGKGVPAQLIHNDQSFLPEAQQTAWVNNVLYMISPFTEANGGTRVVPRSHRWAPPNYGFANGMPTSEPVETIAIEGDAGTAFVFHGRLWHGAGPSDPKDTAPPRVAISAYYVLPILRQAENFGISLHDDIYASLTTEERNMLGFKRASTLNYIEPASPGGRGNTDTPMPHMAEMGA